MVATVSETAGADRVHPRAVRIRFGLKPKLLLLLLFINLLSAAAFGSLLYTVERTEIISAFDARLNTAAAAVAEMVPAAYHQRIKGADSIAPAEYAALQAQLSHFADNAGLAYVYTYMKFGPAIHTVATSATSREYRTHQQTKFFAGYDTAPPLLFQSFADGRRRFDEYSDAFGEFRSIYLPMKTADGQTYVVGADVERSHLDDALIASARNTLLIAGLIFIVSMIAGSVLVGRIVSPLSKLTDFTHGMEGDGFQASDSELANIRSIGGRRRDEVGSLADAMVGMIVRLQRYLADLELATAARERAEGEVSAARDIQLGMVPRVFPPFPDRTDIDLYAVLEPAKGVGGDLYDYFLVDEGKLFFVIGDVSGKGVPAALFMAMTTTLFRSAALTGQHSVGEVFARVNSELSRDNAGEMFVTALGGVLDLATGVIEYSNGGHEAPFVRRADVSVERLPRLKGVALGVIEEIDYATARFTLQPGDSLLLFTDGVSEAADIEDRLFSVEAIGEWLSAPLAEPSAGGTVRALVSDVHRFAGTAPQSDDIAVVMIRFLGSGAA